MQWIYDLQLWVRDLLVVQMDRAVDGTVLTLAAILPLGVLFGALHALTPGHSKTVLASYLLGSGNRAVKSLGVAGILSITHVGMAVLLVLLGAPLIQKTLVGAGRAPSLEAISRGIIIAIGLWLFLRALWQKPHNKHEGGAFGVVAGLIPCPLTLFVMFAAVQRGIVEIGLLWAVAMAGGVMVTLGATAFLAVFARDAMFHMVSDHGHRIQRVTRIVEAAAGLMLIGFALRELSG